MKRGAFEAIVEQLDCAAVLEYKGILFDNWTVDEENKGIWAEMCQGCADKYKDLLADELSDGGMGACGLGQTSFCGGGQQGSFSCCAAGMTLSR